MNAYAERFVQTIQQECLDHFVVLGEKHLQHIVEQYLARYNGERPHQARNNLPLNGGGVSLNGEIVCHERLGGLLKHYHRKAA